MKNPSRTLLLAGLLCLLGGLPRAQAQDPISEAIKAGVTKVIVALDLQVQRLQNKTIWLQNAQKVVENELASLRLDEIAAWTERQRTLYADYYEELWQVKAALSTLDQIREMVRLQAALVAEYKRAYALFQRDGRFTASELEHMGRVYAGILEESVQHLDQGLLLSHSFATRMGDGQRLEALHLALSGLRQNYSDLRAFNAQAVQLSLQREKERQDLQAVQRLHQQRGQ